MLNPSSRLRPAAAAVHRGPVRVLEATVLAGAPEAAVATGDELAAAVLEALSETEAVLEPATVHVATAGPDDSVDEVAVDVRAGLAEVAVAGEEMVARGVVDGEGDVVRDVEAINCHGGDDCRGRDRARRRRCDGTGEARSSHCHNGSAELHGVRC